MQRTLQKFNSCFKPTEKFKEALKNLKVGDILYLAQGAIPHKEVAGHQIVTKIENGEIFVTWGGTPLSRLEKMQTAVLEGSYKPKLLYWEPLIINPETGYVKDHGDLKINSIRSSGTVTYIYPSMLFYFSWLYGSALLALALLMGAFYLSQLITTVTTITLCVIVVSWLYLKKCKTVAH